MLVARVYSVMDAMVVEVSCVHHGDPTGSHLLIREERRGLAVDAGGALRALSDVAALAGWAGCVPEECMTSEWAPAG